MPTLWAWDMRNSALLLLIAPVIWACGSAVVLEPKAAGIQIRKDAVQGGAVALGEVSCNFGMNAREVATNVEWCRNDLRNKALGKGADFIVIETEQIGNEGCPNCVSMFGTAYKKQ
jgi:hypothetical protein